MLEDDAVAVKKKTMHLICGSMCTVLGEIVHRF